MMTDNELNALVAERVMGCGTIAPHRRDKRAACHCSGLPHGMDTDGHIPDYANDIAAAFQVVEYFQSRGFGWRIQLEPDCKRWRVCNHDDGLFLAGWEEKHGYISATATTAPLAICLAALDAVGVTVEVRAGVSMTWDISEKDHDELRSMFGV